MGYADLIQQREVDDFDKWAQYAQQTLGTPHPTCQDLIISKKKIKVFFAKNEGADWNTLCKVVVWAKSHKKRPPRLWYIVDSSRYAWADGMLPELDPKERLEPEVETGIQVALTSTTDPTWRERLLSAQGRRARREVWESWKRTVAV